MTEHRIYISDNAMLSSVLAPSSVELVVTSPPYVTTEFRRGQEFDYEGFFVEFSRLCSQLFDVLVPGGRFALNVADVITKYRYEDDQTISRVPFGSDALQAAQDAGFRLLERFIWDKGYTRVFGGPLLGSYPYPLTVFNNNYFEYIWVLQKPGKRRVKQALREESRISQAEWREWCQQWWRVESITEKFDYHRAIYPVEIPYRLIRMYSYVGDTVLDPYAGTGATMIAADKCGRSSVGFEVDTKCENHIERRIDFEALPLIEGRPRYQVVREQPNAA
jgi:site-specific DNA-methyltransferase (adenine-specific)